MPQESIPSFDRLPLEDVVELFPVVGIGASAGGLAAATELMKHLPDNTGMAFVLVQHLDPHHDSILAELLARHTGMRVTQATQGTIVEPNHVYVIPPNTQMTIDGGVLRLTPRDQKLSPPLPIDHFLCSLAKSRGSRAIGVILSGTAYDGSVGLREIKSAGGITFAQDSSAGFDSMPRNAVAAGVVDLVLSPALIARELSSVSRHSHFDNSAGSSDITNGPPMRKILGLLRRTTNVDLMQYKTPTIQRRLSRRLALHNIDNLETYITLLEEQPEELHKLFDDLLINVTEFFRDPETFELLARNVFPQVVVDRSTASRIRVWVPGCSTGEEVYSIAMCLSEYLESVGSPLTFQIFGTDISERCIQTARIARYPESISECVSPERLSRFFTKLEGGYQVGRTIRDQCVFSRQDVTKDPPLSRMDLISCRNLLIYLGPVMQKRVMAIFNYALNAEGFLVLGTSEALGELSEHYFTIDREHKIYKKHLQVAPLQFDLPIRSAPAPRRSDPNDTSEEIAAALDREVDQLLSHDYAPSGFLVNSAGQVLKFRGAVGPYLAPTAGDATLDFMRLVRPDLATPLGIAFEESVATKSPIRREGIRIETDNGPEALNLVVRPVGETGSERHFLVLFEKGYLAEASRRAQVSQADGPEQSRVAEDSARELAAAREYMQGLVEELRSANEEAQSSNEELQSTNEELQTAKEELQSSNEELTTVNDEMRGRNTELSQLNNDLINLLSSMQVPIIMLNGDLCIRRYTPSAEKVLNIIPSDVGRPISDLKPRIDVPNLEELLRGVIASLQPFEQEVRDEAGTWYSLRIRPYRTVDNRIDGAVLQLVDVNQIKQTLATVEEARDYSDAILSTVREPLLVLDHELRIQTANRSFFETFLVSTQQTLNRPLFEIGNGQWDFPRLREMLDGIVTDDGEIARSIELEQNFDGIGLRTFELNARRVARHGKTRLILLALEDITERKRAAEARYRRLFESAKDGICILDAETGEITDVNPYFLELFGYSRAQFVGKPFWKAPALKALENGPELLRRLQACEIVRLPELSLSTAEGPPIECEIVGNMYSEGDHRVIQFNIRDITERKQFDRKLQQTAKLESLGLLAGGIAHDFNNLLTGIMGNASLALAHAPRGSRYQAQLADVVEASHRAASLTRQMLAYAGKGRFVIRPVNLSELVRDIGALVRSSIPKRVDLQMDLAPGLPSFEADASQIQQVIMNLVINGAESIPEGSGGKVQVTTALRDIDADYVKHHFPHAEIAPGPYLVLEVSDTGSGMDEDTRSKMFDPFFSTKFTGRGLGLAAVQGIVSGHAGAIRVRSAPGQGTTVTVLFAASHTVDAIEEPTPPRRELTGSGLILVVDDEEIVLRIAEPALKDHGYTVLTASNGEDAVNVVRTRGAELALVVLDLTMPVLGGDEAAIAIRELRPDLPIVLSSGYDETRALNQFAVQVNGFIQKPYEVEKLLDAIKNALSKKS